MRATSFEAMRPDLAHGFERHREEMSRAGRAPTWVWPACGGHP